jgi:hypothetical protein
LKSWKRKKAVVKKITLSDFLTVVIGGGALGQAPPFLFSLFDVDY